LLTWLLLEGGGRPDVYEANPLALSILTNFGWMGVATFKSCCSLLALGAVLSVWYFRPTSGSRLLTFLCLVMTGVVGYSGVLLAQPADTAVQELPALKQMSVQITGRIDHVHRFGNERAQICRDVLENNIDLPTALERMRDCIRRFEKDLSSYNRSMLPDLAKDNEVAAYLFVHCGRMAVVHHKLQPAIARLAGEIKRQHPSALQSDRWQLSQGTLPAWWVNAAQQMVANRQG
jgi:hypothetical protein